MKYLPCYKYFKALQLDIIDHTLSLKLVTISYNVALSCFRSYLYDKNNSLTMIIDISNA